MQTTTRTKQTTIATKAATGDLSQKDVALSTPSLYYRTMKYVIEYTTDQQVGQQEQSVLWETWTTGNDNTPDLQNAKDLLASFRATPVTPDARYRLVMTVVVD